VETAGAGNIIDACRANNVNRLLYVTSIGVASDARSSWLRGRARIEELRPIAAGQAGCSGPR
jgi:nucleoside-diphosphate-sugar epimerase